MAVINKGISKAVKEEFINGTHHPDAMLTKLAHLNTDDNRRAYIVGLTKALREKYGMETKRDKRFGKSKKKPSVKKPTVQPSQVSTSNLQKLLNNAGLIGQKKYTGEGKSEVKNPAYGTHDLADAMRKHDMSGVVEIRKRVYADRTYDDAPKQRINDDDRIVEEYVKLDDAHKALQFDYDNVVDNNSELKREIARLQVIISYLEGRK
jgi:hypothetical protein